MNIGAGGRPMNIGWGAIMGCIIGCMPPIIIGPPIGRTICILNIIKSNTTFNLHNSCKKRDKFLDMPWTHWLLLI